MIVLLNTLTNLLSSAPYVIVISLDFSKAFDTVHHSSLLHKLAHLPDHSYNWLSDFFYSHSHCTLFHDHQSSLLDITVRDSPSDLPPMSLQQEISPHPAIIPASNVASRHIELANIQNWAKRNNLKLNCDKSCVVFADSRRRRPQVAEPAQLQSIVRCHSLRMLGVVLADDFSVTQYVQQLVTSNAQTNYALRVLRCHGLSYAALQLVYRATVVARLTYAASACMARSH